MERCKWVALAVLLCACAAQSGGVKPVAARRDVVWNGVLVALSRQLPDAAIAAHDARRLVTIWALTGRKVAQAAPSAAVRSGIAVGGHQVAPELVRATVVLEGDNPYRVRVDVEAGIALGVNRAPYVFAHGAEEPIWVPAKKEAIEQEIERELGGIARGP